MLSNYKTSTFLKDTISSNLRIQINFLYFFQMVLLGLKSC